MESIQRGFRGALAAVFAIGLAACGDGSNGADGGVDAFGQPCTYVFDCPAGYACVRGACVPGGDVGPWADVDADGDGDGDRDGDGGAADEGGADVEGGAADGDGDRDVDGGGDGEDGSDGGPDTCAPAGPEGPRGGGEPTCLFRPPPGEFHPALECAWRGSPYQPERNDVVMTPVVANLTDDNGDGCINTNDVPDIAFVSYDLEGAGCCNQPGTLRVVSGECLPDGTMFEHYSISSPVLSNSAGLAVGDIDGDGLPEIVAMQRTTGTVAFEHDGTVKWTNPDPRGADADGGGRDPYPSLADLDADGIGEVIVGRVVIDGATGRTRWRGSAGLGRNSFLGLMSTAADIDLDGRPEVIAGATAYRADGRVLWRYDYGDGGANDGFAAVANFDADPEAEIAIIRAANIGSAGSLFLLDHRGALLHRIPIPWDRTACASNEGGPPTIADFDGDGRPEVGVAASTRYTVFDLDCLGDPVPAGCADNGVLWAVPNNDCSSRTTGSAVFDFDGDGASEVVYNDERYFRIFRGADGSELVRIRNCSHTRVEYPVIADVDNDGNAEIVFIENGHDCAGEDVAGIQVWGDAADRWVPTRRIWNEHTYHITNVEEDGRLPVRERPNWLVAGFNNFRQNLPDFSPFAAPDLTVESVRADRTSCPDTLLVYARVCNRGDVRVGSGVRVRFYLGSEPSAATEMACSPVATAGVLHSDRCETLLCRWDDPPIEPEAGRITVCADDDDGDCAGAGANNECHEDNNSLVSPDLSCSPLG